MGEQHRTPWPPWGHPAIVILFITGCFHFYRGAPVDGVVFLAVCGWLAYAEVRTPAPASHESTGLPRGPALTTGLLLVLLVLTVAPRYGPADVALVGGIGVLAVVVAATRGDVVPPWRQGPAWPFAVVGLVAALNELTAYLLETSPAAEWRHPAFSDLMDPVFGWTPTRGVLVLAWLAAGVGLLRLMPGRAQVALEGRDEPGRAS